MQIDDTVRGLKDGLPDTRDSLLKIGDQLRQALRMQFPARSFIGFEALPRSERAIDQPPTGTLERCAGHIAPTTFMKMPWLLKLRSVRSSEKFVKLYPRPAFTCLPR